MKISTTREVIHNFTYLINWVGRENGIVYVTRDGEPCAKVCPLTLIEKEEMKSQLNSEKKKRKFLESY
jgi:hypothetical protein